MSADERQTERDAAEIEQQARGMGWVPKEEFRGKAERWVDAATYVSRGKEYIPFLRSQNRELESTVSTQGQQITELRRLLAANQAAIDELKEVQTDTTIDAGAATVKQLRSQITKARQEGNDEAVEELENQLDDARDALRDARKAKAAGTATTAAAGGGTEKPGVKIPDFANMPEFIQFRQQNPWWEKDGVMQAASTAIANDLYRTEAGFAEKPLAERLQRIAYETLRRFGQTESRPSAKVEGGRPSGGGGGSGGAAKRSYSEMPDDAKAACDRLGKGMIGKADARGNIKYKDATAWQSYYANKYFEGAE